MPAPGGSKRLGQRWRSSCTSPRMTWRCFRVASSPPGTTTGTGNGNTRTTPILSICTTPCGRQDWKVRHPSTAARAAHNFSRLQNLRCPTCQIDGESATGTGHLAPNLPRMSAVLSTSDVFRPGRDTGIMCHNRKFAAPSNDTAIRHIVMTVRFGVPLESYRNVAG